MAMSIPTIAYSLDPSINPIESSYRPRLRYIIKTVAWLSIQDYKSTISRGLPSYVYMYVDPLSLGWCGFHQRGSRLLLKWSRASKHKKTVYARTTDGWISRAWNRLFWFHIRVWNSNRKFWMELFTSIVPERVHECTGVITLFRSATNYGAKPQRSNSCFQEITTSP